MNTSDDYAAARALIRDTTGPVTVMWRDQYDCPHVRTFDEAWPAGQFVHCLDITKGAEFVGVGVPSDGGRS